VRALKTGSGSNLPRRRGVRAERAQTGDRTASVHRDAYRNG
jgi:hypothetical protein